MLRKIIVFALLATLAFTAIASADVYVRGHYRNDGTYVNPHWRSDPDGDPGNNWSHKGNVNPHTGEEGNRN